MKQEWPTPRQMEVLKLRCEGKTRTEIGTILGITERGVKYHIQRIYATVQVNSTALLVRWAMKRGIVFIGD